MNTAAPTRGAPGVRDATETVCAGNRYLLSDREMAAADTRATATRPVAPRRRSGGRRTVSVARAVTRTQASPAPDSPPTPPPPAATSLPPARSATGSSAGETTRENRGAAPVVSLDAHPCVGCGACAVVARTVRENPRSGGVEFSQG
jgi:hypothetical protein